jgi:hypothetical protein
VSVRRKIRRVLIRQQARPQTYERQAGNIQLSLRILAAAYRAAASPPTFRDAGFSIHSRTNEDGILHLIFTLVGANGIAVEIGCGDGHENNTTNLILNAGWHALLIDANSDNVVEAQRFFRAHRSTGLFPPEVRQHLITSENVNAAVADFAGEIDLLSLDIDSVDYWVLRALTVLRPRVMVVETPTIWGPEFARTVPNDPRWTHAANPDFYGASLGAFAKLLGDRAYRFIGASKYGTNSFFMKNGVGDSAFPAAPLEVAFTHPRAQRGIRTRSERSRHLPWVDV